MSEFLRYLSVEVFTVLFVYMVIAIRFRQKTGDSWLKTRNDRAVAFNVDIAKGYTVGSVIAVVLMVVFL